MKKISLKYEGKCVKCGREIPAGETAYWEKDRGIWHVDCATPRRERGYASRSLWAVIGGIVILAFVLGGFTVGPILAPKVTMTTVFTMTTERLITVTETSIIASPATQIQTTQISQQKWINPTDPNVINWADAAKYVGKTKTVEGTIVRTYRSESNTVFLNFHDPYQGYFYGVIFASDLKSFPFKPEEFYRGKEVRITGLIKLYQGSPEIIVEDPSQIEVAYIGFSYP